MNTINMQPVGIAGSSSPNPAKTASAAGAGFSEIMSRSLAEANSQSLEADQLVKGLAAGEHANIHETMIAMGKAGISFRMVTRVQQKVIEAYREIMRMQI